MSGIWLSCGSYSAYVAVTGSMWLLQGLCGCYGIYVPLFFRENHLEWLLWDRFTWRCNHGNMLPYIYTKQEIFAFIGCTNSSMYSQITTHHVWLTVHMNCYCNQNCLITDCTKIANMFAITFGCCVKMLIAVHESIWNEKQLEGNIGCLVLCQT